MITLKCVKEGVVSSGTMRREDIIPTFFDLLDEIRDELSLSGSVDNPEITQYCKSNVSRIDRFLGEVEQSWKSDGYYDSEDAGWDLETMCDMLSSFSPEGCYFGSHHGDVACYGFWKFDN